MATNLELDDRLIMQAVKLGGHRTKKAAVTQALAEYVSHLEQAGILDLFGKIARVQSDSRTGPLT